MIIVFFESWIFPVPMPFFYIPELLRYPKNIWKLASVCTCVSVIGGSAGYGLGYFFDQTFGTWLVKHFACHESFQILKNAIKVWGGAIIIANAFTPVPYKLVCLVGGMVHLNFGIFIISSVIARFIRFFSLAFLAKRYGTNAKQFLENKYKKWLYLFWALLIIGGCVMLIYFGYS